MFLPNEITSKKRKFGFYKKDFFKIFELAKNLSFLREVENKTGRTTKRFSIPAFEAIFVASCEDAWKEEDAERVKKIIPEKLKTFLASEQLTDSIATGSNHTDNVKKRLKAARKMLF